MKPAHVFLRIATRQPPSLLLISTTSHCALYYSALNPELTTSTLGSGTMNLPPESRYSFSL